MEKIFETVVIFNTKLKTKELKQNLVNAEITKFQNIIQDYSTRKKVKVESLGEKTLAYVARGFNTGFYAAFLWEGTTENVKDLESELENDSHVIKFITTERDELEIMLEDINKNEQPDAMDVLLGLAKYN